MQRPQNPPRGTKDLLPDETRRWREFEVLAEERLSMAGFGEIRTPSFEATEIFVRAAGETSDIVNKEMYTFSDRSDRSLTLRPEGTAGVVRAYLSNGMDRWVKPVKLWYKGAMYRYERSQTGRYRQFHQLGAEVFGSASPEAEAELIALALQILQEAGINDLVLELNSVGDSSTKEAFQEEMRAFLIEHKDRVCPDCQRRAETNPMRALDCKVSADQAFYHKSAPRLSDHLSEVSRAHFEKLQKTLRELDIAYTLSDQLVRGIDYYTGTVFEIKMESSLLAGQNTICAGGRYDLLVAEFGGPETPAFGWALGIERVMALLIDARPYNKNTIPTCKKAFVYGEFPETAKVAHRLRQNGLLTLLDYDGRTEKKAYEYAQKQKVNFYINLNPAQGGISCKDLAFGTNQTFTSAQELIDHLCSL
ncbi:MAG: histidine--tRNA ligase [Candidatus Caenarcaniphilales bacterium]|nr:histidine--tRNA ligase [Candidatus Caenarcaniphilales bacterium]